MADNVPITAGSGTNVATDDVGGVHYQRVKVSFGADGSAADVSSTTPFPVVAGGTEYETVAASQTTQALGATGATGDYLAGILIVPATTSPGIVTIKDGAGTAITIFAGGASSVSNLVPFWVPLGIRSAAGAWQVSTGANVSAIAVGEFT